MTALTHNDTVSITFIFPNYYRGLHDFPVEGPDSVSSVLFDLVPWWYNNNWKDIYTCSYQEKNAFHCNGIKVPSI